MKKKMINTATVEGYVYQFDPEKLRIMTVKNKDSENFGKEFINGQLDIATDEEGLNVVSVHYSYVTETTKKGTPNGTFKVLKSIIEGAPTWVKDGKDAALKVKATPSLELNDFYDREDKLVSAKRAGGGFLSIVNSLNEDEKKRSTFETDVIIYNVKRVEPDEEKHIDESYLILKCFAFDFRNAILPIELKVKNEKGIEYFENLDISKTNMVFTKVWGHIISATIKTEIKDESAFGESFVRTVERSNREWVVTGTAMEAYEWGEEGTITNEELEKAIADRNLYVAEVKRKQDEYTASKGETTTPTNAATSVPAEKPTVVNTGDFDF